MSSDRPRRVTRRIEPRDRPPLINIGEWRNMKIYKYREYAADGSLLSEGYRIEKFQSEVMLPPARRDDREVSIAELLKAIDTKCSE